MHLKIEGENLIYPYTNWTIDFPDDVFPSPKDGISFPSHNVFWVEAADIPIYDEENEKVVEGVPVMEDGVWRKTYVVEPLSVQEKRDLLGVPPSVTQRQCRLFLLQQGKLQDVLDAIDSIPDPLVKQEVQIEWEYASEIKRDSLMVGFLANIINMDEDDLNQAFLQAQHL